MRQKYIDIPEVKLEDVEHFYVIGSQYDDGILGQANLKADLKEFFFPSPKPVLPNFNGHAYVDLGLPSGLLWATCNVGASVPEDYGTYYAWGETETKNYFSWSEYSHGTSGQDITKYNSTDGKTVLDLEDDAAHIVMGGDWRMPTLTELEELIENTTQETEVINGVTGVLFTSIANSKTLFFPLGGMKQNFSAQDINRQAYYWMSTLFSSSASFGDRMDYVKNWSSATSNGALRCYGLKVRGVIK